MVFLLSLFLILSENVWLNNVCTCWRPSKPAGNIARLISSPYCRYTTPDKQQKSGTMDTIADFFTSVVLIILSPKLQDCIKNSLMVSTPYRHAAGLSKVKLIADWQSIVNQCVVFHFVSDLYNADYVGSTAWHLFQCAAEHKNSAISKYFHEVHGSSNLLNKGHFNILRKCQSKFDCLVFEKLYIRKFKPNLNVQTDSIHAKLFV